MQKGCLYTICIDKLEVVLSGKDPFAPSSLKELEKKDEFMLEPYLEKKNPFYNQTYMVMHNSIPIAEYYCGYKGSLRYAIKNPSYFIFKKQVLYTDAMHKKLIAFMDCLGLEFYKYAKAEIAIDGHDFLSRQQALFKNKNYHRKQPLENRGETTDETKGRIKGNTLGSPRGDKYISIYDKQSNVLTSGEQYIEEFWNRNGLFRVPDRQIDRIELKLQKKQANFLSKELSSLSDPNYLASFFKKHGGHYLEYINDKNCEKRKFIIDWSIFDTIEIEKTATFTKVNTPAENLKPVIKKLYIEYQRTGKEYYMQSYEELVETYHLKHWLIAKISRWMRELRLTT